MEPAATATAIMERCSGESGDFDSVVQIYWPRVFRFALASLRDRDAAEGLTQDCFLHACKAWKGFRGEASIQTWLMRIAVNLVRDASRNRRLQFWKRLRTSDSEEIGRGLRWTVVPGTSGTAAGTGREYMEGHRKPAGTAKNGVSAAFRQDMTLLEIAGATGLSENAVKVHLYRALRAVRVQMGRSE
jgi:RNA polymerase sigma-70 factor (ECF subfamily)